MSDFTRCISALNKAAGRELTADEVQDAFARIKATAQAIKRGDVQPGTGGTATPDALMMRAAELEAERMIADADLKARRVVADAETASTRQAEMEAMRKAGLSPVEAVRRLLVNHPDGKANQFSLESRVLGISQFMKSRITATWDALGPSFMRFMERPEDARKLIKEMHGEPTGDALARKGAQAWLKMAEDSRQWFNDKGGKIGKLEDWGLPQHHSQDMVARAAAIMDKPATTDVATNRAAWVDFILPLVNRDKYTDLAGNPMTDAEVKDFLGHAWDTIATGGASKIEPGKVKGNGARANRHAEERQIHFKDADAQIAYWQKFGDKTLPDILMGHVESMAKDIGFVEHFGSNPNAMFNLLRDTAELEAKTANPQAIGKIDSELRSLERLYNYAAGITLPVANRNVARTFDVLRNLNTAGKLGSAMWASLIGDKVMFEAIGRVNNLPDFQRWHNELKMLNPLSSTDRRALRQNGMMLDYMTQAMSRFGDDLGSNSLTSKLANGVMQISGMSAVNEWRRGAWALTAMDTLGHVVTKKDFSNIGPQDMRLLQSYGITEADWRVWKLATLDDIGYGNDAALTPESVMKIPDADLTAAGFADPATTRRDAMVKLLGAVTSESHVAVIEPGWSERAMMHGGLQRGNLRDDLTRSFWQFKAFPITQFSRILDVGLSRPTVQGKAAFLTTLPVAMTLAGGMLIQVQQLLAGKDPQPMVDEDGIPNWKFWAAAFLKGGSLGLYGDFLFSQSGTTRYGTGPLEAVAGPTIGSIADIATFIAQAPGQIAAGKDPQVAAKALNIAKGFVPGSNLWFTKAATDHMIVQQAQEALNPGYLQGMRSRTIREFGNDWWWRPGEMTPDRPPDLGNVVAPSP